MKVLITEATFTPHPTEPDQGPQLQTQGSVIDVDKTTAVRLVEAGKALYTAKSDDPAKGANTASSELIEAAAKSAKAAAKAAKAAEEAPPA